MFAKHIKVWVVQYTPTFAILYFAINFQIDLPEAALLKQCQAT